MDRKHVLDNPIWNALISGNKDFSCGQNEIIKYYGEKVAPFLGMENYSPGNMQHLALNMPVGRRLGIFFDNEVAFPEGLKIGQYIQTYQMVGQKEYLPEKKDIAIQPLTEKDIPAMLELTAARKPGPFFEDTIKFGNYLGVLEGTRLVSMAGFRLHPFNYMEISAVCTAEDCLGKGYAGAIMTSLNNTIRTAGMIPFLHVRADNEAAISVYKKLGFTIRKVIHIYLFHKEQ